MVKFIFLRRYIGCNFVVALRCALSIAVFYDWVFL
jgi:hypothetical protein